MAPPKWAPIKCSPRVLRRALSVDRGDLPEVVGAPWRPLPVATVVTTAVTTTVSPPAEPAVAADVQEQAKDPVVATEGPELTVETPVVGLVTEPSSPVTSPAEAAAEGAPLIEENILQVWQAQLEGSRLPDHSGVPSGIPEDTLYYSPGDSLFPGQSMSPASPMSPGPSPRSDNEEPPAAVEELPCNRPESGRLENNALIYYYSGSHGLLHCWSLLGAL